MTYSFLQLLIVAAVTGSVCALLLPFPFLLAAPVTTSLFLAVHIPTCEVCKADFKRLMISHLKR